MLRNPSRNPSTMTKKHNPHWLEQDGEFIDFIGWKSHALHLWQAVMRSFVALPDMLLIQNSTYSHGVLHLVLLSWTFTDYSLDRLFLLEWIWGLSQECKWKGLQFLTKHWHYRESQDKNPDFLSDVPVQEERYQRILLILITKWDHEAQTPSADVGGKDQAHKLAGVEYLLS